MSPIVSPRPMCVLWVSMTSGSPPSSPMPTVNETRVRSDGLSNRTATARGPSSGRRANRACFIAAASSRISACSAGARSSSRRKFLGIGFPLLGAGQNGGKGGGEPVRLGLGEDERRGEPHRVGLDGVDEEARLPGGGGDGGRLVPRGDGRQTP